MFQTVCGAAAASERASEHVERSGRGGKKKEKEGASSALGCQPAIPRIPLIFHKRRPLGVRERPSLQTRAGAAPPRPLYGSAESVALAKLAANSVIDLALTQHRFTTHRTHTHTHLCARSGPGSFEKLGVGFPVLVQMQGKCFGSLIEPREGWRGSKP